MGETTAARSVEDALSDVARWRDEESARHQAKVAGLDRRIEDLAGEVSQLESQLADARARLDAVRAERDAEVEFTVSEADEHRRSYDALFDALQEQAQELAGRAAVYAEAARARDAAMATAIDDPGLKKLVADYEAGKQVLATIPEAYRAAVQDAHSRLEAQLKERLAAIKPAPIELEVDPVRIDVVVAVDAMDGVAGVVMAVLPVVDTVYTEWAEREDDVQTFVAARAMQAIYQVCQQLGLGAAQAMYGGHQGLLAVEVELGRGDPDQVAQALRDAVDQVLGDAPELTAAKVVAYAQPVDVDYLFPPDDGEGEEEDDA